MGIVFAILAAITWAIGDFSIEKTSRKTGSIATLFYITFFGAIIFLPFVWRDIIAFSFDKNFLLLSFSSLILLVAAVFDYKALEAGKLSVVEPICAFEVPITALLAFLILGEKLLPFQIGLVTLMIAGIFLVSVTDFGALKHVHAERGVWLAVAATLGMGATNFFFGESARATSPLFINWFSNVFILIFVTLYLWKKKELKTIFARTRDLKALVSTLVVSDNLSWIFYAYAVLTLPIAIAIGVSESYVALAALLGLLFNKEKLHPHQLVGVCVCIGAVIVLSTTLK